MHLLWLLRMVRLRQLFQGESADHGFASSDPQIEFLVPRQFRGHQNQYRRLREARNRGDVCRHQQRGVGATRRPRDPFRLSAVQCPAAAAFGDRPALRSCCQLRAWSDATSPIRPSRARSASSTRPKYNFNPFIASGSIGMMYRRVQRRQFRSWSAGLCRRRLYRARYRPTAGRSRSRKCRRAHRTGARSGNRRLRDNYLSHHQFRRGVSRLVLRLPRRLSRPRSDLQGPVRPAADADDHRFSRQRDQDKTGS